LRQLAEKLSDRLKSEVPVDEFRGDESVCAELVHDNICRVVEGRLRFAHDLFGDWARQRQLLSQGADLKSYLMSRLDCPPWQKALRLLSLHLLERRNDLSDWQLKLADFTDDSHTSKLARDLFLEAAVFAADPVPLLEKLWPELVANEGKLLQRFLKRFLHSATVPDFRVIEYFQKENPDLVIEVAARYRLPYFPFWFSVLSWLHTHLEDVTALTPDEVAEVGRLWLAIADGKLLDRKLAAELVVRNAEKMLPLEMSRNGHLRDTDAKAIYEAALAASGDIPERMAKLVLKLSGRLALDPADIPADVEPGYLGKRLKYTGRIIPSDYIEDDPPQPWPEGPKRSISGGFQQAFLHGNAALPLITHQPVVAAEATLALLISWPRTKIRHSPYGPDIQANRHGFQFLHPDDSFYTSGPFLLFLRHHEPLPMASFHPHELVDSQFDGFAAQTVPVFWAEKPQSREWRETVLQLALSPRLKTVALLCRASAEQRERLGNAFRDLKTFLLHIAAARIQEQRQQFKDKKLFDFNKWLEEWGGKFVEGSMPSTPNKWTEVAIPTEFPNYRRSPHDRDVPRRNFDLDLDFLLWAFSWISPLNSAQDDQERAEWIWFEREALDCVLRTFPENIGDDKEYANTPYEVDRQVFDRIAALLPQLRTNEQPADFWKPILNLGGAAHYWVDDFINSFLSAGLQMVPVSPTFVRIWEAMIEYAFASPQWTGRRFRLREIWRALLGQDWVIRSLWTKEQQPVVAEMKPYIERWAKELLCDAHELTIFFHFVETDAAQFLVSDALDWVAPLLKDADEWFWRREEDRNSFASFLSVAWDRHWTMIKRNPRALEGFKSLAAKLAAHQNPLSLEISSRVATGMSSD
jgi:hypothetical protein